MKKNDELKIERGIPMPEARGGSVGAVTGTLRKLNKGESVFVAMPATAASVRARYALGAGNYACRKVEGGARIWRIK